MLLLAVARSSSGGVTMCVSSFIDDDILARKPKLLDVLPERSACAALGFAINGAQ